MSDQSTRLTAALSRSYRIGRELGQGGMARGESLRDRLTHEKQLPIEDALQIAREVADALDASTGARSRRGRETVTRSGPTQLTGGVAVSDGAAGGFYKP